MNKSFFLGNLVRDCEVNVSQSGVKVARTSMALNRGKDKSGNDKGADFINLVAFSSIADFMERFGKKGRRFMVESHVQTGSYTNKDGVTVYTTDFVIDRVEFADSKTLSEEPTQEAPAQTTSYDGFMNIPDNIAEELLFN